MNILSEAIRADIEQKFEEASEIYEEIISNGDANLEVFINLACLYWEVTDFGFNTAHNLPMKFIHKAGERMYQVLDEAQERFGTVEEVVFWRYYFNFTTLGDDGFLDRAIELGESGSSHVPYFYIYTQTKNDDYLAQVRQLIVEIENQLTTKNRCILSVVGNKLQDNKD